MKIGYLIPEFPSQTHAFFWRELGELKRLGVQPQLLSTRRPLKTMQSHDWTEEAERSTIYLGDFYQAAAGAISFPRHLRRALPELRSGPALACALRLLSIARREGLTHVHAHSCGKSALIAALAYKIGGLHYSLSLHGPLGDYGSRQAEKFKDADFAIAITESLKQQILSTLQENAPPRIEVATMGVDTAKCSRETPYIPWAHGEIRLFSCSRLNFVKGHQELIQAVALLKQRNRHVTLTIAGEDDNGGSGYRKTIEDMVVSLGVESRVNLLGAVSEEVIAKKMERSHLFVLASHHEPLGVAIMEAMSYGVPVISTDAGGVPELIDHLETGFLVPPKNALALADMIESAISGPIALAEIISKARAKTVAKYDCSIGAQILHNLLYSAHNPYSFC